MSGGSYDYVGNGMADGDVAAFLRYEAAMLGDLERLRADVQEDRIPLAPATKTQALIALAAAISAFEQAEAQAQRAREGIQDLAAIGRVLDRAGSGDDGPDQVVTTVIVWMYAQLGIPVP